MMRTCVWLVLSLSALGCSGGFDPVTTVGSGNAEWGGPGSGEQPPGVGPGKSTTSVSTLQALCIQACAHMRAADCEGAPKDTVDACSSECGEPGLKPPCIDEQAALFQCQAEKEVICSEDVDGSPTVVGCEDQTAALDKCATPGGSCAHSAQGDGLCASQGLSQFVVCNEGTPAAPGCVAQSTTTFCCP